MAQLRFAFASDKECSLVDRIREATDSGLAVRTIAKQLGVPIDRAVNVARQAGIRYKHRHPTPQLVEQAISLVVDRGLSIRDTARETGLSKTAVHRFVLKRRQKAVDAAGKVKFETATPGARNPKSWRCEVHGRVTVWPCVACMASLQEPER